MCIVSDNGPGILSDVREELFEKPKSGRRGGTGLGLYLCRQILNASGGRVELLTSGKPKEFDGACFRITLPTVGVKSAPDILVVDDEPMNRRHLFKVLTDSGFTCEVAQNEREAVERL